MGIKPALLNSSFFPAHMYVPHIYNLGYSFSLSVSSLDCYWTRGRVAVFLTPMVSSSPAPSLRGFSLFWRRTEERGLGSSAVLLREPLVWRSFRPSGR